MPGKARKEYEYLFKLVLIGDSSVGKSSLLLRFTEDSFMDSYISTIGVDFRFRSIELDGKVIKLQIWDTAGQERYRTITSAYYRGAHGILMVYDVTNSSSFDHVEEWIREVNRHASETTSKFLIGNKSDLHDKREVSFEKAETLARNLGMSFWECSAKSGYNVQNVFLGVAESLKNARDSHISSEDQMRRKDSILLSARNPEKSGCC